MADSFSSLDVLDRWSPDVSALQAQQWATAQLAIKRALDITWAAVLVTLLFPILVALAVVVLCSSRGPIIFCQQRVGKNDRVFQMYKFRTMHAVSDPTVHRRHYEALVRGQAIPNEGTFKLIRDGRVTPVGRVLRRFSLDELPQLVNVLKGDMSLVGPRPPIPYEVELYGPRERMRLWVTPGLTGLWQVSGRSALTFEEMIDRDLTYIRDWSLWLDFLILLRTPLVVLSGRGAG